MFLTLLPSVPGAAKGAKMGQASSEHFVCWGLVLSLVLLAVV